MIIELLIMKLLAQDVYTWIIVFCAKLVWNDIVVVVVLLMISWSIDVVVVIRCCWWFMLWVFMIVGFVVKFELYLRVLWKMSEFVICVGMIFLIQVSYGFECPFMSINVWINFGNQFGHGESKLGFLEWKWSFSREQSCWALSQFAMAS